MTILATSKTMKVPGPDTRINCSKCGPNVPARTYRQEERMGVFFIPMFTQRETYVECTKCGESRLSRLPLEKLAECPPDELDQHVYHRVSLIIKFMALASVLVFCIPFVGLGFGVAGFIGSRRAGGWVKVVSIIGIVIGTLVGVGTIAAVLFGGKPAG